VCTSDEIGLIVVVPEEIDFLATARTMSRSSRGGAAAAMSRWFVWYTLAMMSVMSTTEWQLVGVRAAISDMSEVAGCWRVLSGDGGQLMPDGAEFEFTVSGGTVSQGKLR
jgi:hypothetical protein